MPKTESDKPPAYSVDALDPEPSRAAPQQSFFARHKKLILIAIAVVIVLVIAIGAGVGASTKNHSTGQGGGSGGDSSCTPPGRQMCESNGDCSDVLEFSSCLAACDGYSYCT